MRQNKPSLMPFRLPFGTLIPILLGDLVFTADHSCTRHAGHRANLHKFFHATCCNSSSAIKPHLLSASLPAFFLHRPRRKRLLLPLHFGKLSSPYLTHPLSKELDTINNAHCDCTFPPPGGETMKEANAIPTVLAITQLIHDTAGIISEASP